MATSQRRVVERVKPHLGMERGCWQRRSSHILMSIVVLVLAACSGTSATPPTATISPSPTPVATPTQPFSEPAQTPIPSPVTESALLAIRERGELRVGTIYNYPPLSFLTSSGLVQGYEPALVEAIAERWGVRVTFIQVTRQTRFPMLAAGEVDMLAGAIPHRRDLEQFVEFTITTFRTGYATLVPSNSPVDSLEGSGIASLGVIGSDAEDAVMVYAGQHGLSPTLAHFLSPEEAVVALESGVVEALVGRRELIMRAARLAEDARVLNGLLAEEAYAFAVRRGDTPLRDLLDLTLYSIIADGTYGELYSANLYTFTPDLLPELTGESTYSFETFPAEILPVESGIERIKSAKPLRVAGLLLAATPAPFDGQPIADGYNRAVINEIARRWNVPVEEIPDSEGQAGLMMLAKGQADLVVGVRPDLAGIGNVAYSLPYYQRGLRLAHMRDVLVLGVDDLDFKTTMIVEPLAISEDLIKDNNGFPRIQAASSNQEAFDALVARGIEAVVGDEFALILMAQTDSRIRVVERLYRPVGHVIAVSPHDPEFLALINFTLQDMWRDGTLENLRQQYFGPYQPEGVALEPLVMEFWPGDGSYLGVGDYGR